MKLPEFLTRERKMPKNLVIAIDKIATAPYIVLGGTSAGLALVITESAPLQALRKKIRPDMENEDLGNFIARFKLGYTACRDAFNYRPKGYYD